MVTQTEIARVTGLDVTTVNKILNRIPGFSFRADTVKRVFRTAEELGYDFDKHRRNYRRRHSRLSVAIRSRVMIYGGEKLLEQGFATISNISLGGAVIRDLSIAAIPVSRLKLVLKPNDSTLKDIAISGRFARFVGGGEPAYAIVFDRLKAGAKRRLARLTGKKRGRRVNVSRRD